MVVVSDVPFIQVKDGDSSNWIAVPLSAGSFNSLRLLMLYPLYSLHSVDIVESCMFWSDFEGPPKYQELGESRVFLPIILFCVGTF